MSRTIKRSTGSARLPPQRRPRLLFLRFAPPCIRYVQIGQDDAAPSHGSRPDLEHCTLRAYAFEILGTLQVNECEPSINQLFAIARPIVALRSVEAGEIDERGPHVKHERRKTVQGLVALVPRQHTHVRPEGGNSLVHTFVHGGQQRFAGSERRTRLDLLSDVTAGAAEAGEDAVIAVERFSVQPHLAQRSVCVRPNKREVTKGLPGGQQGFVGPNLLVAWIGREFAAPASDELSGIATEP